MTDAHEPDPGSSGPGASGRLDLALLVRVDVVSTAVFAVAALGASVAPDALQVPYAALSMLLFAAGTVAFLWAFGVAVARSREEYVSTAGVFFLTGGVLTGAPRMRLLACLAAQTVISVVAASVQLYTAAAFGIMAPMFGLGLAGLAGARFGHFEARPDGAAAATDGTAAATATPGDDPDTTPPRER